MKDCISLFLLFKLNLNDGVKMKKINYTVLILAAILFLGCSENNKTSNKIFVSVLPQKHFVEAITGDKFKVEVMVPPGLSPATYEPLPKQMLSLSDAKLYFRIGVPFENSWIDKIADNNKNLKIVDTREGINLRSFETFEHMEEKHDHHGHSHGHGHSHDHGEKDPHIWLDPSLVKIQAKTVYESVIKEDPINKEFYLKNYNSFRQKLDSLDAQLFGICAAAVDNKFLVFHPSWGYFADRYGLRQFSIEYEGKEPSPMQLAKIIKFIKENNITTIFVQKQFSTKSAETIALEINGTVKTLDPLAENYFENLIYMAKTISGSEN